MKNIKGQDESHKVLRVPRRERLLNWCVHRLAYKAKGLHFSLHFTSRIVHPEKCHFARMPEYCLARNGGVYIQALNEVFIDSGTLIAPGVKIISSNHALEDYSAHVKEQPVRIGKNCWLCANSVILPGVELGDNVVVAPGAVVTCSFGSKCVVAGVPARVVKTLP